ncbi:MAG: hypothetical protein EON92_05525 [Burkholderiales bacterium]|nr:MAG: hypothetical protein EON92_05525 [Burkholderiales bacterium]
MQDFEIDYELFFQLCDQKVGRFGQYLITTSGITAAITERDLEEEPASSAQEGLLLLQHIRDAKLPFPTTAFRLQAWLITNDGSGFSAPTWFDRLICTSSAKDAHAELDKASASLARSIRKTKKLVLGLPDGCLVEMHAMKNQLGKDQCELDAVSSIRKCLGSGEAALGSPAVLRNDALRAEIRDILDRKPEFTPSQVMNYLKKQAGSPGSCVIEAIADGVLWRRSHNQLEKLTLNNLRLRISRIKA